MDDVAALTHHLEYLFLKVIINELRAERIKVKDARVYAKAFIDLEPFSSGDDAYNKISNFVAQYNSFSDLKVYMESYQKEKSDRDKINQMRTHLKNNDIEAALSAAQK